MTARPKILLVDDHGELLDLLGRLIENEGWEALKALRGSTAKELIASQKPAAAVVDVLLPDMMGYDLAAQLKKAEVPFVLMSGVMKGGKVAMDARTQHGAVAFFEKPFDARKLIDALHEMLPFTPRGRPVVPRSPPPPEVTADFDVEVAVETEEPEDSIELTGEVALVESGKVSATLEGEPVTAGPLRVPPRPVAPPVVSPPVVPPPVISPPVISPPVVSPPAVAPPAGPPRPVAIAPPEGELGDRLPDLITAFHLAQQTGELTVQRGKVKKTVFFDHGRPCYAISNLINDRFGPFLKRVGKITQAQLEVVTAAADVTGRRTGEIFVEMGLLKDAEKLYYVAQQVKAIVYSIFAWEDGEYRMHFTDRAETQAIKLDLHPANLILRGVKKLYKPERLHRLLKPDEVLLPSSDLVYELSDVELSVWEAQLLPQVDGSRSVAELVALAGKPEDAVYAFLYAMLAIRICDRRPSAA
jgi:DNA-binding response OmpR family regulator